MLQHEGRRIWLAVLVALSVGLVAVEAQPCWWDTVNGVSACGLYYTRTQKSIDNSECLDANTHYDSSNSAAYANYTDECSSTAPAFCESASSTLTIDGETVEIGDCIPSWLDYSQKLLLGDCLNRNNDSLVVSYWNIITDPDVNLTNVEVFTYEQKVFERLSADCQSAWLDYGLLSPPAIAEYIAIDAECAVYTDEESCLSDGGSTPVPPTPPPVAGTPLVGSPPRAIPGLGLCFPTCVTKPPPATDNSETDTSPPSVGSPPPPRAPPPPFPTDGAAVYALTASAVAVTLLALLAL